MEDRFEKANNGAYNNLLIVALSLVAVYLLVSGFNKSKKQAYLDTAGTDKNSQQAQALHDAFNRSGISIMQSVDGTDTDLVFQTAAQITDYSAVADSYRVIYGAELTIDLQNELSRTDLQKFYDIVYKRGTNPTTAVATGKKVKAKETVNVRKFDNPATVDHQAKAGELLGNYIGEATLTVTTGGKPAVFVIVETDSFLGLFTSKFYVLKTSITIY